MRMALKPASEEAFPASQMYSIPFPNSPAHSNPFFAATTAMISLMTAAAAMVPWMICAFSGAAAADRAEAEMQ